MSDSDSIKEKIKFLSNQYKMELPARINVLQKFWKKIKSGKVESEAEESFKNAIHALVGSGGTFGFVEVTELAQRLQKVISGILLRKKATAEEEVLVEDLLDKLQQQARS